jgi:glycine/D-amino acid oxidase-like deaminating enzyme
LVQNHDLIVIGGGYWGSAVAHEARQRGLDAAVLDDFNPASGSRNASGILHPKTYSSPLFKKYMPADWSKADLLASFEWLKKHCGAVETVEHFTNWTRPDLGVRKLPVGYYISSNEALTGLAEPFNEKVDAIRRSDGLWIVNGMFRAPRLVVAAGIGTDSVLALAGVAPIGVTSLFGRGLGVRGLTTHPSPLVVQTRPYRKFETRPWGDLLRVGDTAEVRPDEAKYRGELRAVADWLAPGSETVEWYEGYRPVCEQFTVRLVAEGLVAASGGHRMGLGLSGLVAVKTLEMLS